VFDRVTVIKPHYEIGAGDILLGDKGVGDGIAIRGMLGMGEVWGGGWGIAREAVVVFYTDVKPGFYEGAVDVRWRWAVDGYLGVLGGVVRGSCGYWERLGVV
jgi:hypothetical protein